MQEFGTSNVLTFVIQKISTSRSRKACFSQTGANLFLSDSWNY